MKLIDTPRLAEYKEQVSFGNLLSDGLYGERDSPHYEGQE